MRKLRMFVFMAWAIGNPVLGQDRAWIAEGRATDAQGNGLTGVTIRASCGWATLMPTGSTRTDSNGYYRLTFGPGLRSPGKDPTEIAVQAAVIHAGKEGFYERDLCRHGDLYLAGRLPGPDARGRYPAERIVLPNAPRTLDFVMMPAGDVEGVVVDPRGAPVPGMRFYVTGEELYPASSVLAQFTTGPDGTFRLSVPCKPYGFSPAAREFETARAAATDFRAPGRYRLKLIFDVSGPTLRTEILATPPW